MKVRRLWWRLARADGNELLDRGRQGIAKRADHLLVAVGYDFGRREVRKPGRVRAAFFISPAEMSSVLDILRHRFPQEVQTTIEQAEKICRHQFDLLGYENLDYGSEIEWDLDAVHGKRAPRVLFYKVRYLDFEKVGDSKVTWELNRHQHLVTLARAYRLTNDARYATEAISQWRHWQRKNPYPIGINWASSLEVAFRSLSWFWMYYLLEGTPVLPADFRREWLHAQALNGRHIERYLSTYFSPNTHLLGEAVALFFLGTLCPELESAARWKSLGWQVVLREARRQVRTDGFYFEQSVYYHVYALDLLLHASLLARRNSVPISQYLEETLVRMLEALALLSRFGTPPQMGDDDGGRVFDPRCNRAEHLVDPLATGAVLFGRGDFKQIAHHLREETVWLLGPEAVAEWDRLAPEAADPGSSSLPDAGLYVLATDEPRGQLIIDAGPQGAHTAGHGHADALSVSLQIDGRNLLIDPGTGEYVDADRARFRATPLHNTLVVDDCSQSEPAGPFSWERLTHSRVEKWITGKRFDYFVGSHDGYSRLEPPAVHRRSVFSLKCGLFLVLDAVLGRGKRHLQIGWNLHPDLVSEQNGAFRFQGSDVGIAFLPVQGHDWKQSLERSQWSPVYGQKREVSRLRFDATVDLPAEFTTLLLALSSRADVQLGTFSRLRSQSESGVRGYRYLRGSDEYLFFFHEGGGDWQWGRFASDAKIVCWTRRDSIGENTLILCDGSYVQVDGRSALACKTRVERCELLTRDDVREISCSEPEAIAGVDRPERVAAAIGQGTEKGQ